MLMSATGGGCSRNAMSLYLLFLFGLLIFPQAHARFWCDKNFDWRMSGKKAINDCDLLQDRLTLYLERLVTVTDCVKTVRIAVEGFEEQVIVGGTGSVQVSFENPARNPNANVNMCKPVIVEVAVEILSGEKRNSRFILDPMNCFDKEKQLTFAEGEGHQIQIDLKEHGMFKTDSLWETCLTSILIEDLEGQNLAYDYLRGGDSVVELMVDRCLEQRLTVVYMFHGGRREKLLRVPRKTKTVYVRGIPTAVNDCQAQVCEVGWLGEGLELDGIVDDFAVFDRSFLLNWTQLVKTPECVERLEVFSSGGGSLLDLGSLQLKETGDSILVKRGDFRKPCSPSENEIVVKVNERYIWRKTLDPVGKWEKSGKLEFVRKGASNGTLAWIPPKLIRWFLS